MPTNRPSSKKHVAIYLPSLDDGGIARICLNLSSQFLVAGYRVTFVLDRATGKLVQNIPEGTEVLEFYSPKFRKTFPALVRFIKTEHPDILLTGHNHKNIMAIWASGLTRTKTRHVASVHTPILSRHKLDNSIANFLLPGLHRIFLRWADCVVAVSNGIAAQITADVAKGRDVKIIPNGVTPPNFEALLQQKFDHPWLQENRTTPTFIAAGRLSPEKNFAMLIKAFAEFSKENSAKLVIFGEGPERDDLRNLATRLGVSTNIDMPGFVPNLFPAMRLASAFILTSNIEGWPLVLAEALACGTPVISTDCLYGPSEILDDGKYGILIPVGDWRRLSRAMLEIVQAPPPRDVLRARGQSFSIARCAEAYLKLFDEMLQRKA